MGEGGKGCRMAKSSFGFHIIPIVVLLISLSPLTAKPGAKPLAKSDPGHLVHDFYKYSSPVYRLRPECQQSPPQFGSGRIFSESQHFVEAGGQGGQNPHQQLGRNNWPAFRTNTNAYRANNGVRKNERMVMLVQEEESSTRGIQDEEETTTSVEEEGSAMDTEDLVEIDQHDKKNLSEQGYHGGEGDQRVQSVSERVSNET